MTITQSIAASEDDTASHGDFVNCGIQLTNQLKKKAVICAADKGAIQSCAAG